MCLPHCLAIIAARILFSYLVIRPKFWTLPHPPLPQGDFLKIESLNPWVRGKRPTKNEVGRLNTFADILFTDSHRMHKHTHTHMIISMKPHLAELGGVLTSQ